MSGRTFRDRYVDLPFNLSEALFVATATNLGSVPVVLRDYMTVIKLPGYIEAEKRVIATGHLLPLAHHGLKDDQVHVIDEAVDTVIRGYTRAAGVWDLAGALGAVCRKVVRRRAEGPAGYRHRPVPYGGGRWPGAVRRSQPDAGSGQLTLTGRLGEVIQESARTALSWLRANASRYGLDPVFHRDTDVHLHVQSGAGPTEWALAGVTMVAALVSAFTGRVVRGDLAVTGEITLSGQVLPVGGIREKVLAGGRRRRGVCAGGPGVLSLDAGWPETRDTSHDAGQWRCTATTGTVSSPRIHGG